MTLALIDMQDGQPPSSGPSALNDLYIAVIARQHCIAWRYVKIPGHVMLTLYAGCLEAVGSRRTWVMDKLNVQNLLSWQGER